MKTSTKVWLAFLGLIAVFVAVWIIFRVTFFIIGVSLLGFAVAGVLWIIRYIKTSYSQKQNPDKWYFIWWGIVCSLLILTIQLILGALMAYMWIMVAFAVIALLIALFWPNKSWCKNFRYVKFLRLAFRFAGS